MLKVLQLKKVNMVVELFANGKEKSEVNMQKVTKKQLILLLYDLLIKMKQPFSEEFMLEIIQNEIVKYNKSHKDEYKICSTDNEIKVILDYLLKYFIEINLFQKVGDSYYSCDRLLTYINKPFIGNKPLAVTTGNLLGNQEEIISAETLEKTSQMKKDEYYLLTGTRLINGNYKQTPVDPNYIYELYSNFLASGITVAEARQYTVGLLKAYQATNQSAVVDPIHR